MDYKKILYWKNLIWKNFILSTIVLIILILILQSVIFLTTPTKTEVESFFKMNRLFKVNSCDPCAAETNIDNEYSCAHDLRRHTAIMFGQIINAGFPLFFYTPFYYFNYEQGANDSHTYVFVVTRDEGPLVYNPINGNFIGSYNDLMQEMGCDVQPYEKPSFLIQLFFPIQRQASKLEEEHFRCRYNIDNSKALAVLDALKLNSTD